MISADLRENVARAIWDARLAVDGNLWTWELMVEHEQRIGGPLPVAEQLRKEASAAIAAVLDAVAYAVVAHCTCGPLWGDSADPKCVAHRISDALLAMGRSAS